MCGHEEDIEECPTCKRYTCQKCFNDMQQKGMLDKICVYCGYTWYSAPTEDQSDDALVDDVTDEQLITDVVDSIDTELAPVHTNPVIGVAMEDSYGRNFRDALEGESIYTQGDVRIRTSVEAGDRMSDVRLITEPTEQHRLDLTQYDPARVSRYLQRDLNIYERAQGELWTISKAMNEIEECQGMAHASVRGLFSKWVDEGQALVKRRAMNNKDAFYVLTPQELEGETRQFIDSEPLLNQMWNRDLALEHMEFNITLKDSASDQPFDLTGCEVYWGHIMGEITDAPEGQVKIFVTKHDAYELRHKAFRIQRNGSQWMITVPAYEREMLMRMQDEDPFERAGSMIMDEEGWAMPAETLTTTLPYDSDSDLKFQAVRFTLLIAAFGAFCLFLILMGLL